MKKTLLLIVIGAILGSTVGFAGSKLFPDVDENAWYADAVASLSEKGIIEGYPDGTFGPNNNVNRAELAVVMDRLLQYIETCEVASDDDVTADDDVSDDDVDSDTTALDSCDDIESIKLLDLYSNIQSTITTADSNITNAAQLIKPSSPVWEGNFFVKGVTAKVVDTKYSSAVEMEKNSDTVEHLFVDVVYDFSDSLSSRGTVYSNENDTRTIEYVTENCGAQVDGICFDHLLFPLQLIVTIDDSAKTAEFSTITAAYGVTAQEAVVSVSYTEADTLYDCVKADLKELIDEHGKTPAEW